MILIEIVDKLFACYMIMLFARILGSWFPEFQQTRAFQFVRFYTDPYLNIFRSIIPPIGGMIDISPILAFFSLSFIEYAVKWTIQTILL